MIVLVRVWTDWESLVIIKSVVDTYTWYCVCSCTSIWMHIIDTCTLIVINASVQTCNIYTYINVFVQKFVLMSCWQLHHHIHTHVRTIESCWHLAYGFFSTTCSILFSLNLHHNFINQFNKTYSLAFFLKPSFNKKNIFGPFLRPLSTQYILFLPFNPSSNPPY